MASNGAPNNNEYPYLRNCAKDTTTPVSGTVKGTIPSWLEGELVRVGPGIQKIGNDTYNHIFDGLAILHKFTVKDGKAYYQSRFLQSDAYKQNMEANRIVVGEFGTFAHPDPCQSIFGRMKAEFSTITSMMGITKPDKTQEQTDNCDVNVAYYGDQLYAMTETMFTRRIDPGSLETIGPKTNIGKYVAVNTATAHPHCLEDGSMINIGNNFRHAGGPHYCFFKVPPSFNSEVTSFANAKLIAEIPARWKMSSAYFHSFGITDSGKLIFVEYPYCLNLMGMVAGGILRKSYVDWLTWHPNEKTRIHVVSMADGKVHPVTYETDHLFLFHHINSFEIDGELMIDVAGYSDAEFVAKMTVNDGSKPGQFSKHPSARRYVLPLNVESAQPGENLVKSKTTATASLRKGTKDTVDLTAHHFTQNLFELPRINYKYNGKPYDVFYGVKQAKCGTYEFGMDTIGKVCISTGEETNWVADEDSRVSEPVFVANPTKPNGKEDDGVILTALLPNKNPTSVSLVILDATTMTEIARSDFVAEGLVTGTFHGHWAQSGEALHVH